MSLKLNFGVLISLNWVKVAIFLVLKCQRLVWVRFFQILRVSSKNLSFFKKMTFAKEFECRNLNKVTIFWFMRDVRDCPEFLMETRFQISVILEVTDPKTRFSGFPVQNELQDCPLDPYFLWIKNVWDNA